VQTQIVFISGLEYPDTILPDTNIPFIVVFLGLCYNPEMMKVSFRSLKPGQSAILAHLSQTIVPDSVQERLLTLLKSHGALVQKLCWYR
jgi:hypothetical protein